VAPPRVIFVSDGKKHAAKNPSQEGKIREGAVKKKALFGAPKRASLVAGEGIEPSTFGL
jgi:hypothetical protein